MSLIQRFVENPVKVAVAVLLLVLFGLIAAVKMPIQLTPDVESPVVAVEAEWPGASPQEVEREITQELEERLKDVSGMTRMTSESQEAESEIRLEFSVGTDMAQAVVDVNSRLLRVRDYPIDAQKPTVRTYDLSDRSMGYFTFRARVASKEEIAEFQNSQPKLADAVEPAHRAYNTGLRLIRLREAAERHPEIARLLPKDINVATMRRFAEDVIEARFERVDGVADARVRGGLLEELQVIVDPLKLAAQNLTLGDIRLALQAENADTSAGDFWEGKRRYTVRTLGEFRDTSDVEGVVVAKRNGATVYISDVAEVRVGFRKPDGLALRIGSESLTISCSRETGSNALDVMRGLQQAMQELNDGVLKRYDLELEQVYDETEYIHSAMGLVRQNIFVGGTLTIAVLLIFLRSVRSTLVVGMAIPICIIGTLLVLHLLGRTLNVISLAGLAFAIGMLVDNAVVVLENIYRHYQSGERPVVATVRGTQEVWGAVVASTLTTLAVFLPVLFVEEEAGQLFRDIALAISSAVGLSLIVSVVMIPTAAAKLFRRADEVSAQNGQKTDSAAGHDSTNGRNGQLGPRMKLAPNFLDRWGATFVNSIVAVNARIQRSLLLRIGTAVGLVLAAIVLVWLLLPKVEYLPTGNRNIVYGRLSLPPGYNLEQIEQVGHFIEEELRPYWDLDLEDVDMDELEYPPIADFFFIAYGQGVFMGLRSLDPLRAGELVPLLKGIIAKVPGAIGGSSQSSLFQSGRSSSGRSIEVEITGPRIERLVELGGQVMQSVLQVIPGAQATPEPSLDLSSPEVHVVPRRDQAADLGLSSEELGFTVNALVDGARVGDYFIGSDRVDLRILGGDDYYGRTHELELMPFAVPTGQVVPLGAVADVYLSSGPEQVNHSERERAIMIDVSPPDEMPLQQAMELIREEVVAPLLASGEVSTEYQINMAGTADKLNQTWDALKWNLALAVLITYLLMAALFESWLYPLVIIMSVPLGAVGGIVGLRSLNGFLYLTGQNPQHLDVITMLGFVILVGTVVNNAILIVHQSLNHMREGMPERAAVLESVRTRVRPIFMTTATTMLGLLPLIMFPGAGSELYRGLGSVVLGGLLVSTVFTLVLVPTLFSLLMSARERLVSTFATVPPEESERTWRFPPRFLRPSYRATQRS